ncbi:MAG: nuclear transport factor 2 family protein [Polyangiaceae bacterium]
MTPVNLIEKWIDLLNRGDAAGCAALYAEDASLHVAFVPPVNGRAAIQAMFEAYFAQAPLHCIVQHLYTAEGDRVVLEWKDKVGLPGINVYELRGGLIQAQRNYFDQLTFFKLNNLPLPKE